MVHSSLEVLAGLPQHPDSMWTPSLKSWMERVAESDFIACWVVSEHSDYQGQTSLSRGPAKLHPSHLWPQFLHLRNRMWRLDRNMGRHCSG